MSTLEYNYNLFILLVVFIFFKISFTVLKYDPTYCGVLAPPLLGSFHLSKFETVLSSLLGALGLNEPTSPSSPPQFLWLDNYLSAKENTREGQMNVLRF